MDTEFWEAVRQRAHALWLEEGCPEGKSDLHWQQAQRDVLARVVAAPMIVDQPEKVTSLEAPPCAPAEMEVHSHDGVEVCAALTPAAPAPPVAQPLAKGTSLFKIKARQCRYITSETSSPTIFCGAPTEGGSWCREHNARVFVRSSSKPATKAERQISAR
jgi:4-amino-4-deoxy-L-arabinose transferase-like glycosyltransferase